MRKSLPYVLPVLAIVFLIFLWWQSSQTKKGSISETAEHIELVAITPSPDKLQLSDSAVSRLELRTPEPAQQDESASNQEQQPTSVTGEIRSLVEDNRLIFSVLLLRAVSGALVPQGSPSMAPSMIPSMAPTSQADSQMEVQDTSMPAVWVKGEGSTNWQLVCQVTDSKGGLQCGGSIALSDLPVQVAVTAAANITPADGPILLEGELPAP